MKKAVLLAAFILLSGLISSAGTVSGAPRFTSRPLLLYSGDFELKQQDIPANCRFSAAPLTRGTLDLSVDWDSSTGRVLMEGEGFGTRRNLKCGDFSASYTWSANYTIDAQGDFEYIAGKFSWTGVLEGAGTTTYFDCEQDGEPASCPADVAGAFGPYPVVVDGTLTCKQDQLDLLMGDIIVGDIALPTGGTWKAEELIRNSNDIAGIFEASGKYVVTLNGRPVANSCAIPVTIGDEYRLTVPDSPGLSRAFKLDLFCGESLLFSTEARGRLGKAEGEAVLTILANFCDQTVARGLAIEDLSLVLSDIEATASSQEAGPSLRVDTEDLYAKSDRGGQIQVAHDSAQALSTVRVLGGRTVVFQPNSPDGVTVNGGQQVTVAGGTMGPVIDLSRNHLPYLSRD